MKKVVIILFIISLVALVAFQVKPVQHVANAIIMTPDFINEDGTTINDRVLLPKGYKRVVYSENSFESYLRHYKLEPFGAKIINYDDTEYYWQKGHIGILDIDVPKNGLQQCADALIRIRSEYLWNQDRKAEIGFNFTSGHYCSWIHYANGFRPKINGNNVTFLKTALKDHSIENFYNYLNLIYMYSGTLSMFTELPKVNDARDLKIGDMLIRGGSPGHIVMICDEIVNDEGEKLFLLFQGNTPAQSVHLVKNLENNDLSPWYRLEKDAVIPVSNYTFNSSKFVRFK